MIVAIRIGFQSAQYTVSEASTVTYIKIEVMAGSLEREIIVSLSTSDSTAIGTYFDQYDEQTCHYQSYFSWRGLRRSN